MPLDFGRPPTDPCNSIAYPQIGTVMPNFLDFWGKARSTNPDGPSWHPAAYHCLDVAAASMVLLQKGVSRPPPPWDQAELHDSLLP